jgi:hypothetical protein
MHLNHAPSKAVASFTLGLVGALTLAACGGGGGGSVASNAQASNGFADTVFVSDKAGVVATATTTCRIPGVWQ